MGDGGFNIKTQPSAIAERKANFPNTSAFFQMTPEGQVWAAHIYWCSYRPGTNMLLLRRYYNVWTGLRDIDRGAKDMRIAHCHKKSNEARSAKLISCIVR